MHTMLIWLVVSLLSKFCESVSIHSFDFLFNPYGSVYLTEENAFINAEIITVTTASNVDEYELTAKIGLIEKKARFGNFHSSSDSLSHVSVHHFNQEIDESTKSIHFLCHSSELLDGVEFKNSNVPNICCVVSVNTSFSHDYSSCILYKDPNSTILKCHTSVKLPTVLWKQNSNPKIRLSSATFVLNDYSQRSNTNNANVCHTQNQIPQLNFKDLPSAVISRSVPDAIRELGGSILLQVPRRELRTDEEFAVSVRLKGSEAITDFTIRCEVPSNSYVEFVRVIWPGGLTTWKHADSNLIGPPPLDQLEQNVQNLWDVFHRSMVGQKRNVTEVVARLREDLARNKPVTRNSQAIEVYKLLFRVIRPPPEANGRVAPRIFWSLVTLGRHNTPDRGINVSPIVTRLNIESSEFTHLAMVLKTTALVNLAALTGQPSTHPVWVYGLTHAGDVIDVTTRATCQTGDDAVIHFANDACHRLGFSGAELDGSPGLPLVAKLDGRSATSTLLVWFPKPPAIKLVGDHSTGQNPVSIKRIHASPDLERPTLDGEFQNESEASTPHFNPIPIRVLARFILAGSVLYDKDLLGGRIDQYVDVTQYTAHRLRIHATEKTSALAPASLLQSDRLGRFELLDLQPNSFLNSDNLTHPAEEATAVWLCGLQRGRARVYLEPIDRSRLSAPIPPGLEKQLKDQKLNNNNNNELDDVLRNDEASLDVIVGEELAWPIGFLAKLVTDFTLNVSPPLDHRFQQTENLTRTHFTSNNFPHLQDESVPVYSSLYNIRVNLIGGRIVHSGKFPNKFLSIDERVHDSAGVKTIRSSNDTRLLLIWIHLSDGSVVAWNEFLKIHVALNIPLPFQVTVDNLKPDRFELSLPSLTSTPEGISEPRMLQRSSRTAQTDSVLPVAGDPQAEWTGPAIRALHPGELVTGEILEITLRSLDGNPLFPPLRLHDVEAIGNSQPLGTQPDTPSSHEANKLSIGPSLLPKRAEPTFTLPNVHMYAPPDVSNRISVLKDAPGSKLLHPSDLASKPSDIHSNEKSRAHATRDETSLSDQTREDTGTGQLIGDTVKNGATASGEKHVSRSVLETSMYVLLGLFALVGLVFAVNCGAVVARYRWERARRGNLLVGSTNSGENGRKTESESCNFTSSLAGHNLEHAESTRIKKKYTDLFRGMTKSKPSLHRDDNWIWISREQARGSNELNPELPNSQAATQAMTAHSSLQRASQPHMCAARQTTTAVLSVGEADMLLLHSPYKNTAWQCYTPNRTHSLRREHVVNPWKNSGGDVDEYCGIQSIRRPLRRHTTDGPLTQRNYQGHECSIRIISNPLPEQVSPGDEPSLSHDGERDRRNFHANFEQHSVPCKPSLSYLGSSSVSMRRRHTHHHPNPLNIYNEERFSGQCFPQFINPVLLNNQNSATQMSFGIPWESLMYRSWVRPGMMMPTGASVLTEEQSVHNVNFRHPLEIDECIAARQRQYLHTLQSNVHRKRVISTNNQFDQEPAVPRPPVRTTSKTDASHTIELRKAKRSARKSESRGRPASLPQNFQATNELYSALDEQIGSTETESLLNPHPVGSNEATTDLNTTTSEESLWWYHPIRHKRKLYQSGNFGNGKALPEFRKRTIEDSERLAAVEDTQEYACPTTCDCATTQDLRGLSMRPALIRMAPVTSASDLAWGEELLSLSHDRLVAYFADMKESMA